MECNRVIVQVNRTFGWELVLLHTIPSMLSESLMDAQRFEQRIYYFYHLGSSSFWHAKLKHYLQVCTSSEIL